MARRKSGNAGDVPAKTDWSTLFPLQERRLAAFIFRLPWQLPINSGSSIAFLLDGDLGESWNIETEVKPVSEADDFVDSKGAPVVRNLRTPFVSVRIWQVPRAADLGYLVDPISTIAEQVFGPAKAKASPQPDAKTYDTVIESVTQAAAADVEKAAPDVASATFERCLRGLNRLLLAYGVVARDPDLAFASPSTLDLFALLATRPLTAGYDRGPVIYLLQGLTVPYAKDFLDPPAMQRVMLLLTQVTEGNPFIQSARLVMTAARAHKAGDNAGVLIATASAGELLLNSVLKLLLIEEDAREQYEQLVERVPGLATRLKREYAQRIGGSWDLEKGSAPVGEWWQKVQGPRGSVLHGGYWPTHGEADEAVAIGKRLETFLGDRLVESRKAYPKTALSWSGPQGMKRRGLSEATVAAIVKEFADELPEFWRQARGVVDPRQPD
jgi:hypothetical protein